jgi:hypothetical protein
MRFMSSSKISEGNFPFGHVGVEPPFTSLGFYLFAIFSSAVMRPHSFSTTGGAPAFKESWGCLMQPGPSRDLGDHAA